MLQEKNYQEQLLEWVGLVLIDSSRIRSNDKTDPFICRYHLPEAFEDNDTTKDTSVVHLRWRGLMSSRFIREVIQTVISDIPDTWFILGSKGFEGQVSFCLSTRDDVLGWDIAST
jgi:ribonuclease P/MRP protein subunit RPP40